MKGVEKFRVAPGQAGWKIEKFLARRLDRGFDHVAKLLRQERVKVAGRSPEPGTRVSPGQEVSVSPAAQRNPNAPPTRNRRIRLRVLFEDPDLAAIVKPAPCAMYPGPGHGTDTIANALAARYPELAALGGERRFGIVHRLDRETSGVLVVARSVLGYEGLVRAFEERRVEKEYVALVQGLPEPPRGEIHVPVGGKEALTFYELEAVFGAVSRIRLRPLTGRTHQLRIHLASIGCPILGDRRHGEGRTELTAQLYLPRLALHAERLALAHPTSGERLDWRVEWPRDLSRAQKRAAKRAAPPILTLKASGERKRSW